MLRKLMAFEVSHGVVLLPIIFCTKFLVCRMEAMQTPQGDKKRSVQPGVVVSGELRPYTICQSLALTFVKRLEAVTCPQAVCDFGEAKAASEESKLNLRVTQIPKLFHDEDSLADTCLYSSTAEGGCAHWGPKECDSIILELGDAEVFDLYLWR
jgi:hypothetical protein